MGILEEYEGFSTRASFNKSLLHFRLVNDIIADFEDGYNLADIINAYIAAGKMTGNQIAPVLSALLVDKYKYLHSSFNMGLTVTELSFAEIVGKWNAADIVISYYHPETGLMVLNPKNPAHWKQLDSLKKYEMVTVYAGGLRDTEKKLEKKDFFNLLGAVSEKLVSLLQGSKTKAPASFNAGPYKLKKFSLASEEKPASTRVSSKETKAAAPRITGAVPSGPALNIDSSSLGKKSPTVAAAAPQVQVRAQVAPRGGRMTKIGPFGVVVTNELFHNGNVEAWKRIIFSYTNKYASYQVQVYYDGEVIHDLNSLFKWGKVKHGTAILVAISGPEQQLRDVSKLRKYLSEGASPRFEQFLHGIPGKDLGLF